MIASESPRRRHAGDRAPHGRRALDGVESAHPLGAALPAPFQPALSPLERTAATRLAAGAVLEELAEELDASIDEVERVAEVERAAESAIVKLRVDTLADAAGPAAVDDFVQRLCAGLDEVLAPIYLVLDNLHAYFDPHLAPDDFLDLLAAWVGAGGVARRAAAARRALVTETVEISRWRGTKRGLERLVELFTDLDVEVTETGGSSWSREPGAGGAEAAEEGPPTVRVRVVEGAERLSDPHFRAALETLVRAATPAHVVTELVDA